MMTYGIPTLVQVLPAQQPPAQFSSLYAFAPGPQAHQSLMHYYGAPIMHPAPVYYAPAFPHAFHAMALQNPNWNMDTGASSHLADNTDYQTGRLLLCCDSTGDLYPVTQQPSSQSPVVLLSFSSTTWHRRLGYPEDDCDHGGEYDNTRFHDLFRQNGIQFRFSCPRTSQQNGKSERMLRTINNLIRTLLFQAYIPPSYWVEALNMAAHLLNILPSTAINNEIPFTKLYNKTSTYEHLRVFGCLCYPHIDVSHKLEPRSTPCIFLGYPTNHHGYRCLELVSNKIIISRHVRFDEDVFPFGNVTSSNKPTYDFLLPPIQTTTNVPTTKSFVQHMDEPNNPITPHPTTPPTSPPQPDTLPSHSPPQIPPQPDTHPSHSSTPIPTSTQTQSHA
ncbi:ribonuclease H-like domain-containing protein [Tanacetum coccineum]